MTTNTDILTLSQLLSPSFPVGGFAYSHGLETAVDNGTIHDAPTLEAWLLDVLSFGGAHSDAVLLNMAHGSDVAAVEAQARAFASSAERLMETDLQGAAFCETVQAVWGLDMGRLCYPVAVGRAAAVMQLDPELTTAMYLQSFMSNLVALGQVDGQKVQTALKPQCARVAMSTLNATLEDLNGCAWASDIAAMQHETQYSRVFRS